MVLQTTTLEVGLLHATFTLCNFVIFTVSQQIQKVNLQ